MSESIKLELLSIFMKYELEELLHAIVGLNQNRAKQKLYESIQSILFAF
jgi:hypothetical protein